MVVTSRIDPRLIVGSLLRHSSIMVTGILRHLQLAAKHRHVLMKLIMNAGVKSLTVGYK